MAQGAEGTHLVRAIPAKEGMVSTTVESESSSVPVGTYHGGEERRGREEEESHGETMEGRKGKKEGESGETEDRKRGRVVAAEAPGLSWKGGPPVPGPAS